MAVCVHIHIKHILRLLTLEYTSHIWKVEKVSINLKTYAGWTTNISVVQPANLFRFMDKCSTWRRLEGLWTTFGVAANFFKFWHKPADLFRFMDNFRREIIETWRPLQVYGQFSTNDTNLQTSSGWWTTFGPGSVFVTFWHKPEDPGRFMDNFRTPNILQRIMETYAGLWTMLSIFWPF